MFRKIYTLSLFLILLLPLVYSIDEYDNVINILNISSCKGNIEIAIIPLTFKGNYYIEGCYLKDKIYICACDNNYKINFITKKYNSGKIKFYFQYTTDNMLDFIRYNKEVIIDVEKQNIALYNRIDWAFIIVIGIVIFCLIGIFYLLYRFFIKKEIIEIFKE